MSTLEERVAYLEGQVSEHSHALPEIRDALRHLEQRIETRMDVSEQRTEARYDALRQGTELRHDALGRRIDALEDKMSRHFVWTVGVQVTTFVAIVAALLSRG